MTLSAADYVLKTEGFAGCPSALLGSVEKKIGSHHATVEPVGFPATTNAADYADVWTVDFGGDVGNEEFRQSECIRRDWRLLHDSHCSQSPDHFPHEASGQCGTTRAILKLKFGRRVEIHGCAASCSKLGTCVSERAYRVSKSHSCLCFSTRGAA